MWQHGHFHWNELNTRDPEEAKAFYGEAVDWTFSEMPMDDGGTYILCMDGDTPCAGIFEMKGPEFEGIPPHWFAYLAVDDIDARLEKAVGAGAVIKRPAADISGVGRFAIIQDTTGAVLGWMTPAAQEC